MMKIHDVTSHEKVLVPCAFMVLAYFAGSKRCIELFSTANTNGLLLSGGLAALAYLGEEAIEKSPLEQFPKLVRKCILMGATIGLAPLLSELSGEVISLGFSASLKMGALQIGTALLINQLALLLPSEAVVFEFNGSLEIDQLEEELRAIEKSSKATWEIKDSVIHFDVDEILEVLSEDDVIGDGSYKRLYRLEAYEVLTKRERRQLEANIAKYANPDELGEQEREVRRYTQKIFGYLLQKQAAWVSERDLTEKSRKLEEVRDLIQRTVTSYNDAHNDCVDQVLSQVENLAILVVDDFGFSEIEKRVALRVISYRTNLIKEVVAKTGEYHAADLERALSIELHQMLKLPLPKCVRVGAAFNQIFNEGNYIQARAAFLRQYDPFTYVVNALNYHTERHLFTHLCQWYQEAIFANLDPSRQTALERQLGADFLTTFERTDASVIYYFLKNGIIQKKG